MDFHCQEAHQKIMNDTCALKEATPSSKYLIENTGYHLSKNTFAYSLIVRWNIQTSNSVTLTSRLDVFSCSYFSCAFKLSSSSFKLLEKKQAQREKAFEILNPQMQAAAGQALTFSCSVTMTDPVLWPPLPNMLPHTKKLIKFTNTHICVQCS